jgi:predicted dithiol-disulfide oxidoreductase (DUF899 family)
MRAKEFGLIHKAKEYLVSRIVAEAVREGVSLSEVEQKMLYFTETGWTLPDMKEVSAEFDRDYDQDEYEAKIAGLIQRYQRRIQAENEEEWDDWTKAAEKLSEEDHYLTVMIDAVPASGGRLRRWIPAFADGSLKREHGDRLRLWLTAMICVFVTFALCALLTWVFGPGWTDYVFRSR